MLWKSDRISAAEEYELATQWFYHGNEVARSKLIVSHSGLVKWVIAKDFKTIPDTLKDDLESEGLCGLTYATTKFDPKLEHRFATYAVWWVRRYITRFLNEWREVNAWGRDNQVIGHAAEIEEALTAGADPEDVRKKFLTWKQRPSASLMVDIVGWMKTRRSLDEPIANSTTNRNVSLHDVIADPAESVAERGEKQEILEALDRELNRLPNFELKVIRERMKGKTYEQAGKAIGKGREWARRLEERGISKLRKRLTKYLEAS